MRSSNKQVFCVFARNGPFTLQYRSTSKLSDVIHLNGFAHRNFVDIFIFVANP